MIDLQEVKEYLRVDIEEDDQLLQMLITAAVEYLKNATADLKNEQLLKHLGVATPADAAKKIFKGEINRISTEIAELSGFENEETTDKTVKN